MGKLIDVQKDSAGNRINVYTDQFLNIYRKRQTDLNQDFTGDPTTLQNCDPVLPVTQMPVTVDPLPMNLLTVVDIPKSFRKITDQGTRSNSGIRLHDYSTLQAFNADETLISLNRFSGDIVDLSGALVHTGNPYGVLGAGDNGDYFWDKDIANRMWGVRRGDSTLSYLDVSDPAGTEVTVFTSPNGTALQIGGSQGNPNDAQSQVLVNDATTIYIIDLPSGAIARQQPLPANYDWAGLCHDGSYYAVVSRTPNTTAIYRTSDGALLHSNGDINHSDFTTDLSGNQYLSYVGNPPSRLDLATGAKPTQGSGSGFGHISGRGPSGFMYVSIDNQSQPYPFIGRIPVLGNWDTDFVECTGLPAHNYNSSVDPAVHAAQITTSKSGRYSVITIQDAAGNPDTYLIDWGTT